LNVAGKQLSQKLEVRKDPNSGGSEADIQEQTRMLFELRQEMDSVADLINEIEVVRSQIYSLGSAGEEAEIKKAGEALDSKLIDLEQTMIELRTTGRGQDGVRWGAKLLGKLGYLANGLASGDFKPTDQQREVQKELSERVRSNRRALDGLLNADLAQFNELLRKRNLPMIKRASTLGG
jgi:hypothetical protein